MWKLRIEDDESNRTIVKLTQDEYTIGRAEDNVVRLTERNVSRRHARLKREKKGWTLYDLKTMNGTFVNQERIRGPRVVRHGDAIALGDYRLELIDSSKESGDDETPAAPGKNKTRGVEYPRLVVIDGPAAGTHFPLLAERTVLGRGEECDIVFYDTSVSRVHAELCKRGEAIEIIDRQSSNGIRVNGRECTAVRLYPGDAVELGDVQLLFLPAGASHWQTETLSRKNKTFAFGHRKAVSRKMYFTYAAGGLFAVFVSFLFLRDALHESGPPTAEPVAASNDSTLAREPRALEESEEEPSENVILEEARELFRAEDLVGAHRKANELAQSSPLRKTEAFQKIENDWAELLLSLSLQEPDVQMKRQILNQILRAQGINSTLRERVQASLASTEQTAISVTDLPVAPQELSANVKSPASAPAKRRAPREPDTEPAAAPASKPARTPAVGSGTATANPKTEAPPSDKPAAEPDSKGFGEYDPAPEPETVPDSARLPAAAEPSRVGESH